MNPLLNKSDVPAFSDDALLLAIECSGACGSVALLRGEQFLAERFEELGRRLSEKILGFIEDVLDQAGAHFEDVAALALAIGPGSFTGLRVGLATVKGLVAARPRIGVVPVGTLDALAFGSSGQGLVSPCLDARRGELYAALFRVGGGEPGPARTIESLDPATAVPAGKWAEHLRQVAAPVTFTGEGARACQGELRQKMAERFILAPEAEDAPRARWVAELARRQARRGQFADAATLVPLYLQTTRYAKAPAPLAGGQST